MPVHTKTIYKQNFSSNGYPIDTPLTDIGWKHFIQAGSIGAVVKTSNTAGIGDSGLIDVGSFNWGTAVYNPVINTVNANFPYYEVADGEVSGRFSMVSGLKRSFLTCRVSTLFVGGANVGIPYRSYRFFFGAASGQNVLYRTLNGATVNLGVGNDVSITSTDFVAKMIFNGANIKTYLDDQLVHDYTDATPHLTAGTFGFGTLQTETYVTELTMKGL